MGVKIDTGGNIRGDQPSGIALRPNPSGTSFKSFSQGKAADGVIGFKGLNGVAFEIPDPYSLGNAGRTLPSIRELSPISFDVMLRENFYWGERWRARFSSEAYNFTNTPAFNIPNTTLGGGSFGIVAATLPNSRRIMQVGLRITF